MLSDDIQGKDAHYRAGLPINAPAADSAAHYYANLEEEFRNFWNNSNYYCVFAGLDHLPDRSLPRPAHMSESRRTAEEVFARIKRDQRQLLDSVPATHDLLRHQRGR